MEKEIANDLHTQMLLETLDVPIWSVLPFIILLLSIAILPLTAKGWWEHNSNRMKIAIPLGLLVVVYLWLGFDGKGLEKVEQTLIEYLQFIILLGAIYIISGGIVLRSKLQATPKVNCVFLGIGAILSSLIGTTGASMLLIRPVLMTNVRRKHMAHTIIFFIFIVSNTGGCLTPLGPPLFLGFLKGVPFEWTFTLWKPWLLVNLSLLFIYYLWDNVAYKNEKSKDVEIDNKKIEHIRVGGGINFLFLGGVVLAVAFSALIAGWFEGTGLGEQFKGNVLFSNGSPFREFIILTMLILSLLMTPKSLRKENSFTYRPIVEVVILFLGIFLVMIPAQEYLREHGQFLGVDTLAKFFWTTGLLSSFLDNTPTYLVFYCLGQCQIDGLRQFGEFVSTTGIPTNVLKAISLGAAFMGAFTYIGNGPNFMVRAIAEEEGVKMPSFFGYIKYSVLILVPIFLVVTFLFFR